MAQKKSRKSRKSRKKSRKLSAYQRFVSKQMKAGKSMAQAAAMWKRTPYAQTGPVRRKSRKAASQVSHKASAPKAQRKPRRTSRTQKLHQEFMAKTLRRYHAQGVSSKQAMRKAAADWMAHLDEITRPQSQKAKIQSQKAKIQSQRQSWLWGGAD